MQSCSGVNIKEISYYQLVYPLITQTVPPSLYYYGTHENYDYFSITFRKYKVLKSNMQDKFRFDFISWDKSHRIKMNLHLLELIPQTIYEANGYDTNGRSHTKESENDEQAIYK